MVVHNKKKINIVIVKVYKIEIAIPLRNLINSRYG